jgi:peptidoglycan hydrolase CwlO-like protein
MRIKTIFIALFFLGAFLACQKETNKVQNFAYAQKGEFVKTMQAELTKINMEIKELEAQVKKLKKESLAESNKKIQALKDKAAQLNMQIDKAGNATESSWDGIKADINKAFGEFKGSIGEMRTWVSKKIAP